MLKSIIRFFNLIHIGTVYLAKILMVAMVVLIAISVFLRYVFRVGLVWSEEVALLFEVWFIFISLGLGVKQKLHISLALFPESRAPRWLNVVLWKIRDLVTITVGVVMLTYGSVLVQFTMHSRMAATGMPAGIVYLVMPIAAITIIIEGLIDLFGIQAMDKEIDKFLSGEATFAETFGGHHD
ncbi:MAG TPA: TRAP transporter small permease subunit [bacterium]|nr:TRAP transporter small permease subunit [bacterium]